MRSVILAALLIVASSSLVYAQGPSHHKTGQVTAVTDSFIPAGLHVRFRHAYGDQPGWLPGLSVFAKARGRECPVMYDSTSKQAWMIGSIDSLQIDYAPPPDSASADSTADRLPDWRAVDLAPVKAKYNGC